MLQKFFLPVLGIFLLYACSNPKESTQSNILQADSGNKFQNPPPEILVNDSTFLALFSDTLVKKLHTYSPNEKPGGNKFLGQRIEPVFHKYFFFDAELKHELEDPYTNIFSCYKFKLSETRTGLVIRTPGQYSETAVDLFVWDKQKHKIINRVPLADANGDGMWYIVQDAWLMDINRDRQLDIITRIRSWEEEDVGAGPGKIHTRDTSYVLTGTNGNFKKSNIHINPSEFKLLDWE